jgi:hypothetical protein
MHSTFIYIKSRGEKEREERGGRRGKRGKGRKGRGMAKQQIRQPNINV